MLSGDTRRVYALGECEIDVARRELRVQGAPVPVGGRAFAIIEVLAQSAGRLVTKNDLMDRIWPGVSINDNTLHVHVSAARKALGRQGAMLKSESGRGYRLLGSRAIPSDGPAPPPVARPRTEAPDRSLRSNFPQPATALIGRDAAVQRLRDLLSAYRVVTLTGPGGIGKTTLALHVAWSCIGEFADGGCLVELASLPDRGLVPSAVASALGLNLESSEMSAEAIARVIGNGSLLLVLDNCEGIVDSVAQLAETIVSRCHQVTVLATSRELLRISGESVYRVPPLEVPAPGSEPEDILGYSAVKLFVARTREWGSEFAPTLVELQSIAATCRRLDGIPLAIEFAAARAATLGVRTVAAGLSDRLALLTSGRRTALPRQQTLRATLDWSYELLTLPEQRVLGRLAIFAGSFNLEDAGAIASDDDTAPSEIVDCLANLVAKSLVAPEPGSIGASYRLLETTRAYALEKLVQTGEFDAVAQRHARRYLELFRGAEAGAETRPTDEWLAEYGSKIDDVRTALDWAFSPSGDTAIGVALTAAAIPLWMHLSLMEECCRRVERALGESAGEVSGNARSEMQLYTVLAASLMYTRGAISEVGAAGEKALELAEKVGDTEYQMRSLFGLWSFRINSGQQRTALNLANRFQTLAVTRSDPNDDLIAERMIGTSQYLLGNLTTARHHLECMLARDVAPAPRWRIIRFEVDQRAAGRSYLARILWLQGLPDQAMQTAERSVADARATSHAISVGLALALAACPIALITGDLAVAEHYGETLLEHSAAHALARWHAFGRSYHAMLVMRRGDPVTGLQLLRAAFDDPAGAGSVPRFFAPAMAEALGRAGEVAAGLAVVDAAIERAEQSEEHWVIPELLRIKGELLRLQNVRGASAAAEGLFRQALDRAHRQGALSWELRCATSLARLGRGQQQGDKALELLASVYDRFTEGFNTADLKTARELLQGSVVHEGPARR